jgi:hypothetical protein
MYVTEAMTWECAPMEYKPSYYARADEYVRFRFVKDPHFYEVESSKDFCSDMRSAARPVVNVEFELWGRAHRLHWYRVVSVDGRPIRNVGGWGNSGANDSSGLSPLSHAFAP